jgi:hypothetical protein
MYSWIPTELWSYPVSSVRLSIKWAFTRSLWNNLFLDFYFIFSTGVWTQDLALARQVLWHLSHSPSPDLGFFVLFWRIEDITSNPSLVLALPHKILNWKNPSVTTTSYPFYSVIPTNLFCHSLRLAPSCKSWCVSGFSSLSVHLRFHIPSFSATFLPVFWMSLSHCFIAASKQN